MSETGRPTVMTPETIAKLEQAFLKGYNDKESCLFANIAPSTLYAYCVENPDFSERKEMLKENVKMHAKNNIYDAIVTKSNLSLSQWYAERKDSEFKQKTDVTSDDKPLTPLLVKFLDEPHSGDTQGV